MPIHDKACLLQNTPIAFTMAILFGAFGSLDVLKLANVISPVARHDAPFLLVVSLLVCVASLTSFTCRAERLVLGLVIVDVLVKLLAITRPQLVSGLERYQTFTATIIAFSCAVICGSAGFWSLIHKDGRGRRGGQVK